MRLLCFTSSFCPQKQQVQLLVDWTLVSCKLLYRLFFAINGYCLSRSLHAHLTQWHVRAGKDLSEQLNDILLSTLCAKVPHEICYTVYELWKFISNWMYVFFPIHSYLHIHLVISRANCDVSTCVFSQRWRKASQARENTVRLYHIFLLIYLPWIYPATTWRNQLLKWKSEDLKNSRCHWWNTKMLIVIWRVNLWCNILWIMTLYMYSRLIFLRSRDSISTVVPHWSFGLSNCIEWHNTIEIESRDRRSIRDATVHTLRFV